MFFHVNWAVGIEAQDKQKKKKKERKKERKTKDKKKPVKMWLGNHKSISHLEKLGLLFTPTSAAIDGKVARLGPEPGGDSFLLCRKVAFPGLKSHSPTIHSPGPQPLEASLGSRPP